MNNKELTKEQIEKNKETFLKLVNEINVDGMLKDELINYLERTDFFYAPASTIYHAAYVGGLCEHSLNVYNNLLKLVDQFASFTDNGAIVRKFSESSLKIVALFHDISKANYYELYMRNVNTGEKNDKGKDIWIQVPTFKVKDGSERFVGVNHEVNSYIIISRYIPLSEDELIAICNHHCSMGEVMPNKDMSYILEKHPLTALLHMADFISTYITENIHE